MPPDPVKNRKFVPENSSSFSKFMQPACQAEM